jgi:hypothetical protein
MSDWRYGGTASILSHSSWEEIDKFAADIPGGDLGAFILAARQLARMANKFEKVLEDRYQRERNNEIYIDEKGKRWAFRQERQREVKDPRGLMLALKNANLTMRERNLLAMAFRERTTTVPHHGYLNQIAGLNPEANAIIRDFRQWDWGDPHLVGVDDGQR